MIKLYLFRPDKTTYAEAVTDSGALSAFDAGRVFKEGSFTVSGKGNYYIDVSSSINGIYGTDYEVFIQTGTKKGTAYEISSISSWTRINLSGTPDLSGISNGDTLEILQNSNSPEDATYIPLEFEGFDRTDGHDVKITRAAGQLVFAVPLKKEKQHTVVFTNMFVGNANEWRVENFMKVINYAKLHWAKITGKLSNVYFRNEKYDIEFEGYHRYKNGTFERFKCIIIDVKDKMDHQNNIIFDSVVVEGVYS